MQLRDFVKAIIKHEDKLWKMFKEMDLYIWYDMDEAREASFDVTRAALDRQGRISHEEILSNDEIIARGGDIFYDIYANNLMFAFTNPDGGLFRKMAVGPQGTLPRGTLIKQIFKEIR